MYLPCRALSSTSEGCSRYQRFTMEPRSRSPQAATVTVAAAAAVEILLDH